MSSRSTLRSAPPLFVIVLAVALVGAHCNSKSDGDAAGPLRTASPGPSASPADEPGPNDGITEDEAKKLLPGIDTSMLTPRQRADLSELASDTFCPCSGTTAAGCLRTQPTCKAAVRLVELSKRMILAGQPQASVLLRVEAYYASFPRERRRDVKPEGPAKGAENAKVTIVEFSDFQCPACKAAHPGLSELVKKYPADVKVVFRNFPLPRHEHAAAAAAIGAFAQEKGRFWQVADLLFERQDNLGEATFKAIAKDAGLDAAAVMKAIDDPKLQAKVEADRAAGEALEVNSTPTLYVNGRQLILPASIEFLSWTVEDELEWLAHGGSWDAR